MSERSGAKRAGRSKRTSEWCERKSERCERMSERCERMSEQTSEWPSTAISILGYSGPLYRVVMALLIVSLSPGFDESDADDGAADDSGADQFHFRHHFTIGQNKKNTL